MKIVQNKHVTDGSPIIIEEHNQNGNKFHNWADCLYQIENVSNTGFIGDVTDGLQLNGDIAGCVNKFYADNSKQSCSLGDECASIVNGADFLFVNCVFSYNGKGVLQGSGDSNLDDIRRGTRSIFYNCLFLGNSRRNPFIQTGQSMIIGCIVANWGKSNFHEKTFGIRAGSHAQVTVIDTIFIQESLGKCLKRGHLLKDTFNHYFWPFWVGPGFRRAVYADWGGQVTCYNCYKNRKWLYLKNHKGKYMDKDDAYVLINKMSGIHPYISTIEL